MTWTTSRSRAEVLRDVIDIANTRLDGTLPTDVEGVSEKFDADLDLLGALQLRWHTGLAGRIENTVVDHPIPLEAAAVTAWRTAAEDMPGIRMIVDRFRAEPSSPAMASMLARAVAKEHLMLAVMAGHGDLPDEAAIGVGAQIEELARSNDEVLVDTDSHSGPFASLIDRIKAVIAA